MNVCVMLYPIVLEVQKNHPFLDRVSMNSSSHWIGFVGKINRKQSFFTIVYGGFRLKLSHQSNDSWDDKNWTLSTVSMLDVWDTWVSEVCFYTPKWLF